MLIDPLTDADCTCLRTLAITTHRPCCATRTDHLTKVVQTLYLVYIPPNETGSPQTAHLCILPSQLPTWIPLLLPSSSSSSSILLWVYSPCSSSPPSSISLYIALSLPHLTPEGTSSKFLTTIRI